MDRTLGLIYSQRVLLALIDTGMAREEAYDTVQPKAMEAWEKQVPFRQLVEAEEKLRPDCLRNKLTTALITITT